MKCASGFENSVAVYYINCKRHSKRLEKFKKSARSVGITGCKQVCVDGNKFTKSVLSRKVEQGLLSKNAKITPIEGAIALSFYKVFENFLKSGQEYALILEDDVQFKKNFVEQVDLILDTLKSRKKRFDVLYLQNGNFAWTKSKLKKIAKINDAITIYQETVGHNAGNPAFMITRKFAEHLVGILPIKEPYDMYMGYSNKKFKKFTVNMKVVDGCDISPLVRIPCGDKDKSTQDYSSRSIKQIIRE